jgi:[acyl-carrier-protein] S-malonyltransferase
MSEFFDAVKKAVVCTPNLNPDVEAYDRGVLGPWAELEKLEAAIGEASPSEDQLRAALALLKTIFDTKQVDPTEQRERFGEILAPLGQEALSPLGEAR